MIFAGCRGDGKWSAFAGPLEELLTENTFGTAWPMMFIPDSQAAFNRITEDIPPIVARYGYCVFWAPAGTIKEQLEWCHRLVWANTSEVSGTITYSGFWNYFDDPDADNPVGFSRTINIGNLTPRITRNSPVGEERIRSVRYSWKTIDDERWDDESLSYLALAIEGTLHWDVVNERFGVRGGLSLNVSVYGAHDIYTYDAFRPPETSDEDDLDPKELDWPSSVNFEINGQNIPTLRIKSPIAQLTTEVVSSNLVWSLSQ